MSVTETYATVEESKKRIINYHNVPLTELFPGCHSHIVSGERGS